MLLRALLAVACSVVAFSFPAQAQRVQSVALPYYGSEFFNSLRGGIQNDDLKRMIEMVLRADHQQVPGQFDQLAQRCNGKGCYRHTVIGYNRARVFLMGYFYLVQEGNQYGVRDVYCERVYGANEFGGKKPGPNQIPDNNIVNVEHTWPQSRFSRQFPAEEQKSDLHHLYPTDSKMNSIRSSFMFGEVVLDSAPLKCPQSRFGRGANAGAPVFEPPARHKGNVARALFYFSIRYHLQITPSEEMALRRWNKMDPVDQEEMARNNEIYRAQGSRNPFVDYPDLADRISDF